MLYHILFLTKSFLAKLGISPDKGQGLAEYALILLLVALAVIGGLTLVGVELNALYQRIVDDLPFG